MDGGGGEEVGGVGGVGLDVVGGGAVTALGDDDAGGLAGVGVAFEFGEVAEVVHEAHGHGDVGPGGLGRGEVDADFVSGEGGDHEDGGEELGGLGGSEVEGSAGESVGVEGEGWEAVLEFVVDADAEVGEELAEVADGALSHAGDAVKAVVSASAGEGGGEEAEGGSGVSAEEVGGGGGDVVAGAGDADGA